MIHSHHLLIHSLFSSHQFRSLDLFFKKKTPLFNYVDGVFSNFVFSNLAGGIFTFMCVHGLCIGHHIIPKAEGRNDPFTVLRTRFKVPPKIVIYDFACQLQE
jgi:hypothetical protein